MAQALSNQGLPRLLLLQAGGSLQHARGLLSILSSGSSIAGSSSSSSSSCTGSSGAPLSQEPGRSISTTRGIYMGRAFIRENLQKHPAQSPLFTRDNYQYLEKNGWSLAACEQVLHNHQGATGHRGGSVVHRQLAANIDAATDLEQLQVLVNRHAHQMPANLFARAIYKVPQVMLRPNGKPDHQAAALVLETIGQHLQPKAAELHAGSICYIMAAYAKCNSSPPADLMHELLQCLLLNDSEKLRQSNSHQLGQLLMSLGKMVQPSGSWPLMRAVLQHATDLLKQQLEEQQQGLPSQQQQQLEGQPGLGSGSSEGAAVAEAEGYSSSSGGRGQRGGRQQQYGLSSQEQQQAWEVRQQRAAVSAVNSTALIALLLDRCNTFSPEYVRLLYQWLEDGSRLQLLYPNAACQLWAALKGQWAKFEARTAANAGASTAAGAEGGAAAEGAAAGDVPADASLPLTASTARLSPEEYQQKLFGFFGQGTLESLARATVPLAASMTEANLGQLISSLGRLRYINPELLAAATDAFASLCAVKAPTPLTKANAMWAASQLQQFEPKLVMPAVLGAVQQPEQLDGFLAARIMIATSQMPQEAISRMQLLLRQELHRLSGARGPAPVAATAAADPATAAAGQVPDWVSSLADSLAGRVPELRPREIAYILLSYSQLPGVPVHEGLFSAAAEHITAHADTFVQLDDMEMVATAFEKFNFKAGLPALKALQEQSERLVSGTQQQ